MDKKKRLLVILLILAYLVMALIDPSLVEQIFSDCNLNLVFLILEITNFDLSDRYL